MSEKDIRTLMTTAVGDAPAREFSTPVIASAASARTRRRRAWYGVGALGTAAAVTVVASFSIGLLGGAGEKAPVASGPTASAPATDPGTTDPGAIGLPVSLPLGELVAVIDAELPSGTAVGELGVDSAFTPEGAITLALTAAAGASELAITATASGCTAESADLDAATLDAISAAVCAAAAQYPNQPGTVLDGGSIDPAA